MPDPSAPDLSGDGQYQRALDADVFPGQLREPLDRADDRRTRGAVVEPLQPEDVSIQRRDPSEKPVERREGVLPDHKDRVDPKRRADHVRQVALDVGRELVVQEVLLGLIEDQVDVARELSALEDIPKGPILEVGGVRNGRCQRGRGILAPAVEDDHDRLLRKRAQPPRDRGAEQRRLPDAARPVEHRQAGRDEVRNHDLGVPLPAEEVEGVEFRVLERRETSIGGGNCHVTPSRRRSRRPTYSSGSTVSTSMSNRRQNARSSAVGSGSIAHDR